MAGTIQVHSCRKQLNLTLRLNKDSSPESLSQAMTENSTANKDKSCSKKVCEYMKNMRSDGEKHSKRGTCGTPTCRNSSVGQANGDRQRSCRKYSSKMYIASYDERNRQIMISEDQKKNDGRDGESNASISLREPVRKMVVKSIDENSYIRAMPSGNTTTTDNSNGCSSLTNCPRPEDSITKTEVTNGALDTATVHLTEDKSSASNSKTITHEQYITDVNQTNETLTRWSGSTTTEQSYASYPDPKDDMKIKSNEMTATAATDNVSSLKTTTSDPFVSNVNQTNEMTSTLANGPSYITNLNTTYSNPFSTKDNQTKTITPLPKAEELSFPDKCGCNNLNHSKECSCKCATPVIETVSVMESYDGTMESISESDTISREVPRSVERSIEPPCSVVEAGVQTSFVSIQQTPCYPASCPRRKRRTPKDLISRDVQTESTSWVALRAVESKTSATPHTVSKKITISTTVKHTIPPKRSRPMEDRLLRRIMYFDSNKSSVCNKDVEFCTYRIHRSTKTMDPQKHTGSNKVCPVCSDKKCRIALSGKSAHVTCGEIAIEVVSLELSAPVVSHLLKACFFVYIDYVFLGHVGNETFLAPLSRTIHFDSRRSYCVSMKFNKKERSILREQVKPTGLLAKDTIMFILVCHAAPEFDILKNWDFAYGYLSMKTLLELNYQANQAKSEIEMTKIGSTEKIGTLNVVFEGLELVKTIRDEDFECIEQRAGHVLQKLTFITKDIKDIEKNQ